MDYELSHHAAKRMLERKIEPHWVEMTLAEPDRQEQDPVDPTARHALKRIEEMDNRILRVVYNTATGPLRIITAHFDRRLKDKP